MKPSPPDTNPCDMHVQARCRLHKDIHVNLQGTSICSKNMSVKRLRPTPNQQKQRFLACSDGHRTHAIHTEKTKPEHKIVPCLPSILGPQAPQLYCAETMAALHNPKR
ncbi:hypothetical protein CYMTET_49724 [Cymbomonas tetramitiformis]|uniref:Uncharacterized protein n=1 Tax=Cymbomonas tetramitiformis TaxID=36881 RepID=A0AAE0BQY4_9CHLO|nr:hypothetical protein CYMTET_49724 [Cymbomonas tetramitiformis]